MRFVLALPPLALLFSLSACFSDPADEMTAQTNSGPPPAELCQQFRVNLDALRDKGAIEYENDGTALVEERVWIGMGGDGRDKLGQMLAFHAACSAKQGMADQPVIIRNEMGIVVTRRKIDTRLNTMSLIAE